MSSSPFSKASNDKVSPSLLEMLESLSNGGESLTKSEALKSEQFHEGNITPVPDEPKTFDEIDFSQYFLNDPPLIKTEEEDSIFSQDSGTFTYHQSESDQPSNESDQQSSLMTSSSNFMFETVNHSQQSASTDSNTSASNESGKKENYQEVIQVVQHPQIVYGTFVQYGDQQVFVPMVSNTANGQMQAGFLLPPGMVPASFQPNQAYYAPFFMQTPSLNTSATASSTGGVSKPSPAATRRSKRRLVSSTAPSDAISTENGSLVLPEVKAQGTYTLTGEKIRRPPNAFMIFAKSRRRELLYSNSELSNKDVSKLLGVEWNTLPEKERNKYKATADELRTEHQIKFPGYVYNPMVARRAKKERKLKSEQKKKQSLGVKNGSVSSSTAQQESPPTNFQNFLGTASTSTATEEATGEFEDYNFDPNEFM